MVIKTANKKFGPNFDMKAALSDATHAYYETGRYHDGFKGTKRSSTFFWEVHRQMDGTYKDGIEIDKSVPRSQQETMPVEEGIPVLDRVSYSTHNGQSEENGLDQEEAFCYGLTTVDAEIPTSRRIKSPVAPEQMEYVPKYTVCLESFREILPSLNLNMILQALSEDNSRANRKRLKKLVSSRRSVEALSDRIRQNLIIEATKAGYKLYVAVCINGARNNVLVAARSEKSAAPFLERYGQLMEIMPLNCNEDGTLSE